MGSEEVPVSSSLRRRNSFPSSMVLDIPIQLESSSYPNGDKVSSSLDFELFSFKPSSSSQDDKYTSLKDLMPYSLSAAVQSPTGSMIQPCYEISIRNRLVKQAAWAYLQPMSSSPGSSGNSIKRMWFRFVNQYVKNPIKACLDYIKWRLIPMVSRVFNRLIGSIWLWGSRGQ
ncbi:uncharacterized protein LOC113323139 [Papaver somniferum]|uniref:uncharacterized protein LOC113323139 n=1 Tax=Papaver somniferum TaxID=3469 RepID=UPI000E7058B6|nr:uncharacterized protein LOC113323139 [Papaver somniferum]